MCGIVGLLVRDRSLEARLGELVAPMVSALGARGADSTGIGIYRDSLDGQGSTLEVTKDVGAGVDVCRRYGIANKTGYLVIGHTRMATESAVTPAHSHPFVAEPDLCLVHNGSFSNYASVRRRLQADGVAFDSDNDSEVATRFLAFRLAAGDDLEEALRWMAKELDGFYTLAITSADSLAVIRDAFACKPAVVAETDRYVAVASEYRALAGLPDIEGARVFEPNPAEIYLWSR
jgi:glutamate synthase domain-containing protein 1